MASIDAAPASSPSPRYGSHSSSDGHGPEQFAGVLHLAPQVAQRLHLQPHQGVGHRQVIGRLQSPADGLLRAVLRRSPCPVPPRPV